ncbi:hypothetical protein AGRA3207_001427 [Actinomadura graeca]|uniref:DUF6603 domain-containing protein n=1 Tax=Actinomadura graeca TaxID=2750812 RepID=A0ABX8QPK9_9ACTN|nr:DUF6603 domain-containing protein [Actinomadura graeca]QXJ20672.1 hypothetical protein AGRA3207_001427 [Actinomadura graeca]
MDVKALTEWLGRIDTKKPLTIPQDLPDGLDFRNDVDMSALRYWETRIKEGTKALKELVPDLTKLTLTGKPVEGVTLTLRFFAAADKPQDTDLVIGVELIVSLDTHDVFKDLVGVGIRQVRLNYRIEKKGGDPTTKKWRVRIRLSVDADRLVELITDVGQQVSWGPFTFTSPKFPSWSLADTLTALRIPGVTMPDVPLPPKVFPDVGELTLRYERVGTKGYRVLIYPSEQRLRAGWAVGLLRPDTDEGKATWAASGLLQIGTVKLSDLDVLRGQLPPDSDLSLSLQVVYASRDLGKDDVTTLNQVLKDAKVGGEMPTGWRLNPGVTWCAHVQIGQRPSERYTLLVRPKHKAPKTYRALGETTSSPGKRPEGPVRTQRSLGPLHLKELTLRYLDGRRPRVVLSLDAALAAAGLTVEAAGLGLEVELKENPRADVVLGGLGVAYSRPPLEAAGSLVRREPGGDIDFAYDGLIMIKAARWGLMAFGSYASMTAKDARPGYTSVFLFGALLGTFGGPPPVVFTGVCGGFGYNSKVRFPAIDQVTAFPFVKALDPDGYEDLTKKNFGEPVTPGTVLAKITGGEDAWVVPAVGELWLAAGVAFSVAQIVDVQALLMVQLGDDIVVGLLGACTIDLPAPRKTGRKVPGVAHVELGIRAVYQASTGEFSLAAALSDNSWLAHQECKLTGGAAIHVWAPPSPYAGDFVASLGGYHPAFERTKPRHYPDVPRLGLSWSVGSAVSVRGQLYAAVTPAAAMVGGRLEVNYRAGGLHAWLTAYFDVIVRWAPLYYDAEIGLSIGCSFTVRAWLFTVTVRLEIGARLRLWGPPTRGTARLKAGPFNVEIKIGSGEEPLRGPLGWDDFRKQQLPDKPVTVSAVSGLVTDPVKVKKAGPGHWVATTDGFSFATRSAMPATTLTYDGKAVDGKTRTLHVRPMEKENATSTHAVVLKAKSGSSAVPVAFAAGDTGKPWYGRVSTAQVPKALWGDKGTAAQVPGKDQTLPGAVGVDIVIGPPTIEGIAFSVPHRLLRFKDVRAKVNPLAAQPKRDDADPPDTDADEIARKLRTALIDLGALVGWKG